MLAEMDEEFGIADLISEVAKEERSKASSSIHSGQQSRPVNLSLWHVFCFIFMVRACVCMQAYDADALKGLKVEHDVSTFKEGKDVTLVIKDTGERCLWPLNPEPLQ